MKRGASFSLLSLFPWALLIFQVLFITTGSSATVTFSTLKREFLEESLKIREESLGTLVNLSLSAIMAPCYVVMGFLMVYLTSAKFIFYLLNGFVWNFISAMIYVGRKTDFLRSVATKDDPTASMFLEHIYYYFFAFSLYYLPIAEEKKFLFMSSPKWHEFWMSYGMYWAHAIVSLMVYPFNWMHYLSVPLLVWFMWHISHFLKTNHELSEQAWLRVVFAGLPTIGMIVFLPPLVLSYTGAVKMADYTSWFSGKIRRNTPTTTLPQ